MTRKLLVLVLAIGMVVGVERTSAAQGPYAAQIQAALRAFLTQAHTWTGVQTFSTPPVGLVGGSNTQVQFNDSGSFGGNLQLLFDKTGGALSVGGTATEVGMVGNVLGGTQIANVIDADHGTTLAGLLIVGNRDWNGFPEINVGAYAGTTATPTALAVNDTIFRLSVYPSRATGGGGFGWNTLSGAGTSIETAVDSVDGGGAAAGIRLTFWTSDVTTVSTERLRLDSLGNIIAKGPVVLSGTAGVLSTDTTTAHTLLCKAYDVNDAQYRTFCTATNGDTPSWAWAAPAGGSLTGNFTTLQVAGTSVATTGNNLSVFAATTSAQFLGVISDETGSGVIVGNISPTIATPITSGSTPAVANVGANSCGTTAATIAGNDTAGDVVVGATAGTQCRVTFTTTAPTKWDCTVNNTTTANLARATPVDTTHVDFLGTFVAGDDLSFQCSRR